jgi:hypothetical protein
MKIRNGFVSNSSSSSFCIQCSSYKNVFELAQMMVLLRDWDNDDELFNKIEEDKTRIDPNSNISFSTCNYNTFIVKIGEQYVVQTCHNHQFREQLNGINDNFPKPDDNKWNLNILCKEDEFYEIYDYYENHLQDTGEFWFPEYGVWGMELGICERDNHKCGKKDHNFSDIISTRERKYICSECFDEENKDKLPSGYKELKNEG